MVNVAQTLLLRKNELYVQFQGAFFENQVAAAITATLQSPLYYWTSNLTAEVDFLIEYEGEVIPLEAKSGESLRSKSLHAYIKKYDPKLGVRISHRPLAKNGKILARVYRERVENCVRANRMGAIEGI
jgi:hypothetical protein